MWHEHCPESLIVILEKIFVLCEIECANHFQQAEEVTSQPSGAWRVRLLCNAPLLPPSYMCTFPTYLYEK